MPSRAIARSSISFGLVSIPVEVFPATASKSVHFNLLHAKDNSRIEERIYCVSENKGNRSKRASPWLSDSKSKYVSFTNEELKSLSQAQAMKSR
jgi:DNA end-binding protein Ku